MPYKDFFREKHGSKKVSYYKIYDDIGIVYFYGKYL